MLAMFGCLCAFHVRVPVCNVVSFARRVQPSPRGQQSSSLMRTGAVRVSCVALCHCNVKPSKADTLYGICPICAVDLLVGLWARERCVETASPAWRLLAACASSAACYTGWTTPTLSTILTFPPPCLPRQHPWSQKCSSSVGWIRYVHWRPVLPVRSNRHQTIRLSDNRHPTLMSASSCGSQSNEHGDSAQGFLSAHRFEWHGIHGQVGWESVPGCSSGTSTPR
jgi:hypothetical protein